MAKPRPRSESRILFICWDAPEAAYLESLFLPILSALRPYGIHADVLQFTWGPASRSAHVELACRRGAVNYRRACIWRTAGPFGPALSALAGALHVHQAVNEFGSNVLMPRSTMPAFAVLSSRPLLDLPIIFDADGLALDERVEFAGLSSTGLMYRFLRDVEAQAVRRARAVLVRSQEARDILLARAGPPVGASRFHIVANGRDSRHFCPFSAVERASTRSSLGVSESAPLVIYVGSLDGEKYRLAEMLALFAQVLRRMPDARLLMMTSSVDVAAAALRKTSVQVQRAAILRTVPADQVPRYIAAADLGLAIIKPCFSMRAVAPIKVAEYLLCGVPVVGTEGVGDTHAISERGVFKCVTPDPAGFEAVLAWFERVVLAQRERLRIAARETGCELFSLEVSVDAYRTAIESTYESSDV